MTAAIAAVARAIIKCRRESPRGWASSEEIAKACIEAAIASGALVPASAVADMRERCLSIVRKHKIGNGDAYDQHDVGRVVCAKEIEQEILDLSPACGDYVVVPRATAHDVWAVECGGAFISLWLTEENANKVLSSYQRSKPSGSWRVVRLVAAMLTASTIQGGSSE